MKTAWQPFKYETLKTPQEPTNQKCWMKSTVYPAGHVHLPAAAADVFITGLLDSVSSSPAAAWSWFVTIAVLRGSAQFFWLEEVVCILSLFWALNCAWGRRLSSRAGRQRILHYSLRGVRDHRDLLCHSSCNLINSASFMLLGWSINAKEWRMGGHKSSPVLRCLVPSSQCPA